MDSTFPRGGEPPQTTTLTDPITAVVYGLVDANAGSRMYLLTDTAGGLWVTKSPRNERYRMDTLTALTSADVCSGQFDTGSSTMVVIWQTAENERPHWYSPLYTYVVAQPEFITASTAEYDNSWMHVGDSTTVLPHSPMWLFRDANTSLPTKQACERAIRVKGTDWWTKTPIDTTMPLQAIEAIVLPSTDSTSTNQPDTRPEIYFSGSSTSQPLGESFGDFTAKRLSGVGIGSRIPLIDNFTFGLDVMGLSLDLGADSSVTTDSSIQVGTISRFIPMVTPYLSYGIPTGDDNRIEFFAGVSLHSTAVQARYVHADREYRVDKEPFPGVHVGTAYLWRFADGSRVRCAVGVLYGGLGISFSIGTTLESLFSSPERPQLRIVPPYHD